MALTAETLMTDALETLQDPEQSRWKPAELRRYINQGLVEMARIQPSTFTEIQSISLVAGTTQTLPDDVTTLIAVLCNTGGAAIRVVPRMLLDSQYPDWPESAMIPRTAKVQHAFFDSQNPRQFLVFPGNSGAGMIDCEVARRPTEVPAPQINANVLGSYTANVDVPVVHEHTILNFVISRAYEKDSMLPGQADAATGYRALFLEALGQRRVVEQEASPLTRPERKEPGGER